MSLFNSTIRLATAALLTLGVLIARPVQGYEVYPHSACTVKPGRHWPKTTPVKVRLDINSLVGAGIIAPSERALLEQDVRAAISMFNDVWGSDLTLTLGTDMPDSFNFVGLKPKTNGTIVIGGVTQPLRSPAYTKHDNTGRCRYEAVNIAFNNIVTWRFGLPLDAGVDYWKTGRKHHPPTGPQEWFLRIILVHELGHALGLQHETDTYAMLDQRVQTWQSDLHFEAATLLPDDRAGLRALYGPPAKPQFVDLSVTNTWWHADPTAPGVGAADQHFNCRPSATGTAWEPNTAGWNSDNLGGYDPFCTVGAVDNHACPGRGVQVRFTVNNNGTYGTAFDSRVYYANPSVLTSGRLGRPATIVRSGWVPGERSVNVGFVFDVPPDMAPGTYHVQVVVDSGYMEPRVANDRIPIRGTIEVVPTTDARCK